MPQSSHGALAHKVWLSKLARLLASDLTITARPFISTEEALTLVRRNGMLHIFEPILSNSKESGEQHTRQQPQPAARWHSEPRRAPQLRERLGGRLVSRNIRLAMRRIGTRLRNTKRQVRAVCRVAGVWSGKTWTHSVCGRTRNHSSKDLTSPRCCSSRLRQGPRYSRGQFHAGHMRA